MQRYVQRLHHVYRSMPALWERDCDYDGFRWIDVHNAEQSVISFERRGIETDEIVVVVCNFSRTDYGNYRVGVPMSGSYELLMHSGEDLSAQGSFAPIMSDYIPYHGRSFSVQITLKPFSCLLLHYIKQDLN
jgi:1,4-alpha-glucan branching enzyme